ncbi:MAG TPA: 1-deoxy-D-xylulose-5-phosphate reductoisomerase [Spirochaetota bacterium]|jgi:1-deoxy-D-xylulose-5-phosphate reductoisomerase|nr:1-deoxy-D-xylulose-5-phosphate reductoisomerase [Spirochaetota bacterium]HPV98620.1 1-deoxy-D-xylulose-5-phosphate reductoisomerase [Spirochaetota bacterium]
MSLTVSILGSTGSIGVSALRAIRSQGTDFRVSGLACNRNTALLGEQIEEFRPSAVAVASDNETRSCVDELKARFPDVEFFDGPEGVLELARRQVDIVLSAIVGAAGLRPTLEAVPHARRIALANKETLVMAGSLFMDMVRVHGVELIPVDSEHSAVFSLLERLEPSEVERIVLTASGGSLRDRDADDLGGVTPGEALNHPTWSMGSKITIDSATLMNKGLEVIEAHHLFDMAYDDIDVLIHPESVIHSMVETIDGSLYALLGVPDMALPILSALTHPKRRRNPFGRLRLEEMGGLSFRPVDARRYPALDLCYAAGRAGGTAPAALNGANEAAVGLFLEHRIGFTDIVRLVEEVLSTHRRIDEPTIDDIFRADAWAREAVHNLLRG